MSYNAIDRVLRHSTAKGTDKLILAAIASHDGPGGSWPSVSTLAHYANVDRRAVQRALARLTASGELRIDGQAGGNESTRPDRRPNRYVLTIPERPQPHRGGVHDTPQPTTGRREDHPVEDDGAVSTTQRGGVDDVTGRRQDRPNRPEPSVNRPSVAGDVARALTVGGIHEGDHGSAWSIAQDDVKAGITGNAHARVTKDRRYVAELAERVKETKRQMVNAGAKDCPEHMHVVSRNGGWCTACMGDHGCGEHKAHHPTCRHCFTRRTSTYRPADQLAG